LVTQVECNLRFACGSSDEVGVKRTDLEPIAHARKELQNSYRSEVVEIQGVGHSVKKSGISERALAEYFDCLFNPFN